MKNILLINATVVLEKTIVQNGFVYIKGEKIESVGEMEDCPIYSDVDQVFDCTGKQYVIPGMIDMHIHGAAGYDFMDSTIESFEEIAHALAKEGTTSFLATTMTNPIFHINEVIENLASYMKDHNLSGMAEMLGIHVEGPFINKVQKGAQPEDAILVPNVSLFKEWQTLSGDNIKVLTFAPELDNHFELLKELKSNGVIPSMGHTDGSYDECLQAIDHGVEHATHLFNGMRGLHHRDPGVVGSSLLNDNVYVEVIPDGIHFHPDLLKMVVKMKGLERMLVITDGIRAKGMSDGVYDLGGQSVKVKDGKCVLTSTGSLAGSIVTMNNARKNLIKWLGLTIHEQLQVTSANQAKRLGLYERKGSIQAGKDADIVVLGENDEVELTICRGLVAFQQKDAFK
ncbi:N-acetylglucosamine-6-phosphate deacetylase [Viridibacillus arvi]|uniref:N-acetylglucosamine-6-phosphate deacetylase n=1 Tax=Viridibacillus arvi TaxID=263475 RepID=UPI003D02B13B